MPCTISPADIKRVKAMGFLNNKGTDLFNARIITAKAASIPSTMRRRVSGGKPSRYPLSLATSRFRLSWSFQYTPHIVFLILFTFRFIIRYRLIVCKSLFSMMVKPSMVKPLGLSSDRDAFSRRQVVTRLRSVTLLCRMIFCVA